jgi:hypothetical protein
MQGRVRALISLVAPIALVATVTAGLAADTAPSVNNALWIARSGGLTQVATDDGAPSLALELGADAKVIAIDAEIGSVWTYTEGRLHAFGPDGARWLDAAVTGPKGIAPVDLAVSTSTGTVWLAGGKTLYR